MFALCVGVGFFGLEDRHLRGVHWKWIGLGAWWEVEEGFVGGVTCAAVFVRHLRGSGPYVTAQARWKLSVKD